MNKQQLANRIWASANNMRNKIDANEYKDYILGLIFYKFLSDTEVKYFIEDCEWEEDELVELVENYEDMNMKNAIAECQEHIGFFIEYKYLFNTWLTDTEFSVATLSEALSNFERLMSENFASVYAGIFKTLREGLSKLGDNPSAQTKALKGLIKLIKDIPTDGSQDYDVLGYIYEFLISNFAAHAGKKAGEFYTPHEVAMVMSEIVAEHHKEKESLEIYDPTSGSGSLLITIGKAVSKHIRGKNKVKYYAQELKENTYNLTRMNLVMRGIIPQNIVTRCADTLEEDWRRKPRPTMLSCSMNCITLSRTAFLLLCCHMAYCSVARHQRGSTRTVICCPSKSVKKVRLKAKFVQTSSRRTILMPLSVCQLIYSLAPAFPHSLWY